MVEYSLRYGPVGELRSSGVPGMLGAVDSIEVLDAVFGALSDPTRRDILRRVAVNQLNVGQIAKDYNLTFAAVSKHLKVLEKAKLIFKSKVGRKQYVRAFPDGLRSADEYLEWYRGMWEGRLESLDKYLKEEE